ncbi:3-methyl-2-oxobutanoate hydroxymethyltransferase [Halomarina ordinaria]|uniref:3-methyl-2-oxobutanoate hydroxymethyltransferase n=1 Tax=Halomarina ordinaria TaxID=3033939 RepID=A0ABD5UCM1_9EURY|nr:3-methyl-2-oxobutanoate hydroxymethyltransferase [Halomarina sp. PSRA2]
MPSLTTLQEKAATDEPITLVNAYDYATARLVDRSDVDIALVGDSLGVTMLGYDGTDRVTVDEMVHHASAVSRAVEDTFVMVDLPFGAYNVTPAEAVRNANRLKKESGADAVKLEGGSEVAPTVEAIDAAGITVFGHLGVTPQTDDATDGYDVHGETSAEVNELVEDARAVDAAGAAGMILELVDPDAAATVTEATDGITLGIGAGPHCDAQAVTLHDLLGLQDVLPETVAGLRGTFGDDIVSHLDAYHEAVGSGEFPP